MLEKHIKNNDFKQNWFIQHHKEKKAYKTAVVIT